MLLRGPNLQCVGCTKGTLANGQVREYTDVIRGVDSGDNRVFSTLQLSSQRLLELFFTTIIMAALSDDPSPSNPKPRPKSHTSPPFADNVVRPFTSQGSSSRTPLQLLTYGYPQRHYDDRPASADGSRIDTNAKFGPYVSASARTSYTRVDVDALSSPIYPVLSPPHSATFPTATGAANLPDASAPAAARAATPTPSTPASDVQPSISEPPIPQTPQVSLTFLLVTGLRKTQSFDPETTVGRVKELVWNAWPARDAGPSPFPFPLRDMIGWVN